MFTRVGQILKIYFNLLQIATNISILDIAKHFTLIVNYFSMINFYSFETGKKLFLPFYNISCGFPSPAQDYIEPALDLNELLINNPDSTFFGRVSGNSMVEDGYNEGDVLIIDRSLELKSGRAACCCLDGEFTIKKIRKEKNKLFLVPANRQMKVIEVLPEQEFLVWGVVTYLIKNVLS